MTEKQFKTTSGDIHYWTNDLLPGRATLVMLPGLTTDHHLFDKQVDAFESEYNLFVWDAAGHAASRPFDLTFSLMDKAEWLHSILEAEGIKRPILVRQGSRGTAESAYGRQLMAQMMHEYDAEPKYYSRLVGHGYAMLAEAIEANLSYDIDCPCILICGEKDKAGDTKSFNRRWAAGENLPIHWIAGAGHNSNTDKPEEINSIITQFLEDGQEQHTMRKL